MLRRLCSLACLLSIFSLIGLVNLSAAEPKVAEPKVAAPKAAEKKPAESKPDETVTPAAREDKMKRHNLINERVKQTPDARILFIGDSITQGWETNGKDVWEKYYGKRNAVNLGISGDRTQHVLWRLDHGNIDGISPKVAVIMIGTNNISRNEPEQIAAGVRAITTKLKSKLPKTEILLLAIFPRSATPDDAKRQAVVKTNAMLEKQAAADGVHYLDIGNEFLAADGTLSKEIMPDLLHLSPKGYEIWAKSIEPAVAKIVEPVGK